MPARIEKQNACGFLAKIITCLARLCLIAYTILAVLSLLEMEQLFHGGSFGLRSGSQSFYHLEGDTLYVSLAMCAPSNLDILDVESELPADGSAENETSATLSPTSNSGNSTEDFGASSNFTQTSFQLQMQQEDQHIIDAASSTVSQSPNTCRSIGYLINACAAALAFSAFASILYIVIDLMARYGYGPINTSAAGGMGLFLVFILLQAAISVIALKGQTDYWVDYFQDLVDDANNGAGTDVIEHVESETDTTYWWITAFVALAASGLALLDWLTYKCCTRKIVIPDEEEEMMKAQQTMSNQQRAIEVATQGSPRSMASGMTEVDLCTPQNGDMTESSSSPSTSSFDKDAAAAKQEIDFNVYTRPSVTLTASDRPSWVTDNV